MMKTMTVRVMTPDEIIFEGKANRVRAQGWNGYFTVLPHHAPMVAALEAGEVQIEETSEKGFYIAIDSGIIEIGSNHVNILSQVAVIAEEPHVATAKMEEEQRARQEQNIKSRKQAIKSEMELYRLLREAHES